MGLMTVNAHQPKMETAQQRRVEIRVPDLKTLELWKKKAGASKLSLSKFIIEHVDNSLKQEFEEGYSPRANLIIENKLLAGKVKALQEEVLQQKKHIIRLDKDYERLQAEARSPLVVEGVRDVSLRIVETLRKWKNVKSTELLGLLRVEPHDTKVIELINIQLKTLELGGIISKTTAGWRWEG